MPFMGLGNIFGDNMPPAAPPPPPSHPRPPLALPCCVTAPVDSAFASMDQPLYSLIMNPANVSKAGGIAARNWASEYLLLTPPWLPLHRHHPHPRPRGLVSLLFCSQTYLLMQLLGYHIALGNTTVDNLTPNQVFLSASGDPFYVEFVERECLPSPAQPCSERLFSRHACLCVAFVVQGGGCDSARPLS